jgi:hypothetical protein
VGGTFEARCEGEEFVVAATIPAEEEVR